ncbi:hypothetical protein GQ44DRAFT_619544 [Phaeosphaeriaceae sp. PMI808]|nr:hypothetical protein GQ44DRAFT_619544 [Phaeosphaeriaceae sp. PMI808]
MLSRATIRALRTRPVCTTARTLPIATSAPQWTRTYASNNRRKDNTWKRGDAIKFDEQNKAHTSPVNPSEQPEFDAASSPPKDTQDAEPITEDTKPQKPLPDLRQGIPSTFAAEFAEAEARAKRDAQGANSNPDEQDPFPGSSGGHEGGGGELPRSAYETSTDRRRNRVANWSYLVFLLFGATGAVFMGRNWETEEEELAHPDAPNGWGLGQMYARGAARINGQRAYYTEPTFQKLLPDKDKIPGGAPELTLVLSMEDLLLHSEWSTKHGYRVAKRPGLDYFVRYLSSQYELVIFTSVRSMDADPIIRKLDPFRLIAWPLYREATRFEKGEYVKDLSYLNRDLSKVIMIDTNPDHAKNQPENAIILPKWKGEPGDKGLVALIPFLEYMAMMSQTGQPVDVRAFLKSMEGKDIPTEYARREAKLREAFNHDLAEQKRKTKSSVGGMFMKGLGLDAPKPGMVLGDQNISQGMAEGKMMIDMYRDFNRQNYEHLEKQIREHGDTWLKEMAEEEKKMQEMQMNDIKTGAFGWLGGNAEEQSTPAPSAQNQTK